MLTQHRFVLGWEEDLKRRHDAILTLRDARRENETRRGLENIIHEEDTLWPPMLVTYANLLRPAEEVRLQVLGLVFVSGRHTLGGRPQKILVVRWTGGDPLAGVL